MRYIRCGDCYHWTRDSESFEFENLRPVCEKCKDLRIELDRNIDWERREEK